MRRRFGIYGHQAAKETLVPWVLVEPAKPAAPDPEVRTSLFGEAKLGLLYSGNFGRAHSHEAFFELARVLKEDKIVFTFGVRGNRADFLRDQIGGGDTNIRIAPFSSEAGREARVGPDDIHLVSLNAGGERGVFSSE